MTEETKKTDDRVDECLAKIEKLLDEYNCSISFDYEIDEVVLFEKDTLRFVSVY